MNGVKESFTEEIAISSVSPAARKGVLRLGQVGYLVKGVALSVIGGLLTYATVTVDRQQAQGLDGALQTILAQAPTATRPTARRCGRLFLPRARAAIRSVNRRCDAGVRTVSRAERHPFGVDVVCRRRPRLGGRDGRSPRDAVRKALPRCGRTVFTPQGGHRLWHARGRVRSGGTSGCGWWAGGNHQLVA